MNNCQIPNVILYIINNNNNVKNTLESISNIILSTTNKKIGLIKAYNIIKMHYFQELQNGENILPQNINNNKYYILCKRKLKTKLEKLDKAFIELRKKEKENHQKTINMKQKIAK